MRVTVNAERIEIATSLKCHPEHWMKNAECSGGKSSLGKDLNNYLSALRQKVFNIRRSLIELDKEVTAKAIRYYLTGDEEKPKMILDVFRLHNERMEALIGIDFLKERLSYNLKPSDVAIGIDKGKWIFINRKKTEAGLRIPLLPDAVVIMDRYENNSRCVSGNRLLPVLSKSKNESVFRGAISLVRYSQKGNNAYRTSYFCNNSDFK